jgi:hypothetical protein
MTFRSNRGGEGALLTVDILIGLFSCEKTACPRLDYTILHLIVLFLIIAVRTQNPKYMHTLLTTLKKEEVNCQHQHNNSIACEYMIFTVAASITYYGSVALGSM